MKIPNPWPSQPHIRFNVNNGECLGSCGPGPEIEVPDMAVEVLIEPVAKGRYNSKTLAPGHIWSKEFGMLDVADHLKKVEIKKEEEAISVRQEAERRRKQNEAKPKIFQEGNGEKERQQGVEVKDPVGIEIQTYEKEESKPKINVERAASGLAKVTKALK